MKIIAWIVGIVFFLAGLLGFISNPLVGQGALLETNLLHDIVHLMTGILFVVFAMIKGPQLKLFFKVLGIVYLLAAVLGFIVVPSGGTGRILGILAVNSADNWFHLIVSALILYVGFFMKAEEGEIKKAAAPAAAGMPSPGLATPPSETAASPEAGTPPSGEMPSGGNMPSGGAGTPPAQPGQ